MWADGPIDRLRDWLATVVPSRDLGRRGERVAARHLRRHGMRILARNVRAGRGEIDLVAADGPALVLVEVKARTMNDRRDLPPLAAIDERKRRALRRSGLRIVRRLPAPPPSWRIDVVTVEFEATSRGSGVRSVRWYPGYVDP